MIIAAQIFGILAVVAFLLSFQFKKRKNIIAVNILSRILYILQYILLGAFEGAALDFMGAVSSMVAKYKETEFVRKHWIAILVLMNVLLTLIGLLLYENIFSLFAIGGIILETTALWITSEINIRRLSIVAAPFWLIYNMANSAYGSAAGNVFAIISIMIAILRYDIKKEGNN